MQHDHAQQGRRRRNWCWWCQSMSWQQGQSFFQRAHIASIHCDLPSTSGFPPSKDISDRTYIRIVWVPWRGNREVYNDHSSDDATKVTTTTTYIRIVIVVFPPLSLIEYSLRYDNNNDSVVMAFSPVDGVEKNTHTDALPSVRWPWFCDSISSASASATATTKNPRIYPRISTPDPKNNDCDQKLYGIKT